MSLLFMILPVMAMWNYLYNHSMRNKLTTVLLLPLLLLPNLCFAELLLYGGAEQDHFLGCLDCTKYHADSICNQYGVHGSRHSSDSIWNDYGSFGGKYSAQSPWNAYAARGQTPVIIDGRGKFYGYFTINQRGANVFAFNSPKNLKALYETLDGDLDAIREKYCR